MNYRKLTGAEISALQQSGCTSVNWEDVNVRDGFDPGRISNTNFGGEVYIGDNVEMRGVFHMSGYRVEDNVKLMNIGSLSTAGESSFGNGTRISVLNEGGGRELIMYDRLTAQIAYMLVTCRHDSAFIEAAEKIITGYCTGRKSRLGLIGSGSSISHCGTIRDVRIEGPAVLEGAAHLSSGTVLSSPADPVKIGGGVTAKHFIVQSGSVISDGALIDNCFIGQGVRIGKQYSAENSAFFANCEGFHGEAVSLFAGPYTVTHHKSTLLIAAMFSFFNAGSGSNQSNHMYKLGPLHQGIFERGSKTGSFSYMLWPSRAGAYSVVIGKHYTNFDAGDFPFSYISEEGGMSLLTPAMNMFTVGTRRDSQKWPARDRRKDGTLFDIINFGLFNPYVIGRILTGTRVMKELLAGAGRDQEYVTWKGLRIKRLLLKTCSKYYEMAVKIYAGEELIKRLEMKNGGLSYDESLYSETWVDAAGMLIPKDQYVGLMNDIKDGTVKNAGEFDAALRKIAARYDECSWAWCALLIKSRLGVSPAELSCGQLVQIIDDWKQSRIKLNNMILKDAEKEFDLSCRIGYGVDGGEEERDADFDNVRGTFADSRFTAELNRESANVAATAERLIASING